MCLVRPRGIPVWARSQDWTRLCTREQVWQRYQGLSLLIVYLLPVSGPTSVCNGVVGDCRHIPSCHLDAECVFREKIEGRSVFQCKCKKGFFGNGIQCASEDTGAVGVDPHTMVTVKATLTRDYYGKNSGAFPEPSRALTKEIEKINTECTGKFSKCQTNLNVTIKG